MFPTPATPSWLYKIEPGILGGGAAQLGQSWSNPTIATIKTASGSDTVFLMAGGYDTNQDKPTLAAPAVFPAASDTMGRAVFALKVADGTVSSLNVNGANYPNMTHSIVDLAGFDTDGNGFVNRVYAGDLGGKMFAFEDDNGDGAWSGRTLFSASADGVQRKCFYAPDAVSESYGEMIFFGTGDRENPKSTHCRESDICNQKQLDRSGPCHVNRIRFDGCYQRPDSNRYRRAAGSGEGGTREFKRLVFSIGKFGRTNNFFA